MLIRMSSKMMGDYKTSTACACTTFEMIDHLERTLDKSQAGWGRRSRRLLGDRRAVPKGAQAFMPLCPVAGRQLLTFYLGLDPRRTERNKGLPDFCYGAPAWWMVDLPTELD